MLEIRIKSLPQVYGWHQASITSDGRLVSVVVRATVQQQGKSHGFCILVAPAWIRHTDGVQGLNICFVNIYICTATVAMLLLVSATKLYRLCRWCHRYGPCASVPSMNGNYQSRLLGCICHDWANSGPKRPVVISLHGPMSDRAGSEELGNRHMNCLQAARKTDMAGDKSNHASLSDNWKWSIVRQVQGGLKGQKSTKSGPIN
jgi:hypothetical protein